MTEPMTDHEIGLIADYIGDNPKSQGQKIAKRLLAEVERLNLLVDQLAEYNQRVSDNANEWWKKSVQLQAENERLKSRGQSLLFEAHEETAANVELYGSTLHPYDASGKEVT